MTSPRATPIDNKLQWVIEQYEALLPDSQAAIDACLVALPRRPVSERTRRTLRRRRR
jgi:hypothetical protein